MFDHESVKIVKVNWIPLIIFLYDKFQIEVMKKYKVKGHYVYNYNQFTTFQIYSIIFFDEFFSWFFSPKFSVFEAHFQEHYTLENKKICNEHTCTKSWMKNSQILIFKIRFLMLKIDFKRHSFKKY